MKKDNIGIELIFVHVPKTAGTAMRKMLFDIYGQESILLDYRQKSNRKPRSVEEVLETINTASNFKVIYGHFHVKKYYGFFPDAKRIVWLREPIKRLISHYHFWARTQKKKKFRGIKQEKKQLLNFAQKPANKNLLHTYVEDLNNFWFVGIQDFFEEDLAELKSKLGWPEVGISKANQNRTKNYKLLVQSVMDDPQLKQELIKLNQKDIELYQQALMLREKRINKLNKSVEINKKITTMTPNPLIEILEVEELSKESELLLGFNIDALKKGQKIDTQSIPVTGWLLSKASPATAVEILSGGKVLQKVPLGKPRPGVGKRFPEKPEAQNCGFAAAVGVLGLPQKATLRLRAYLADGSTLPLADIKLSHQPLRTSYQPQLQPLMLTSSGRSGTTWMMQLLSQHPAIVTCQIYAYETRVAPFWMQLLQFLSQRANPVETPFGADYPPKAAAFCQQTLDAFYLHLAEAQGQTISPAELTYFAEKNSFNPNIDLLMEIYPQGKEIILVRDFRDVASSILAFNKKRGSKEFGRNRFKNDEEHLREVMKNASSGLLQRWKKQQQQARLVRYEDLILSPEETLTGIFRYLNLDNSQEAIARILEKASADTPYTQWHQTSSSAKDSIGRWRQDLEPSLQKVCNQVLAKTLREFGYSPD
jgi:hypothetical protein